MNHRKQYDRLDYFMILITLACIAGISTLGLLALIDNEHEAYYRGVYTRCLDTEPQRYSISMLNDPNTPYVRDFTPICREITREYLNRGEAGDTVPGWEWPITTPHR